MPRFWKYSATGFPSCRDLKLNPPPAQMIISPRGCSAPEEGIAGNTAMRGGACRSVGIYPGAPPSHSSTGRIPCFSRSSHISIQVSSRSSLCCSKVLFAISAIEVTSLSCFFIDYIAV